MEIYLPHTGGVTLQALHVEAKALAEPIRSDRPRWITYGSSITQCAAADSPALTWPAIVARKMQWDLTCLGFAGQCHAEPLVARVIRDLPADVISLCLGINIQILASMNLRTFRPAVIGMIAMIREKHANTPIIVMSPIISPPRETTENAVGMTLQMMRDELRDVVHLLRSRGDKHLYYINGLDIMGEEDIGDLPDQLHPNGAGYRKMAERVLEQFGKVLPPKVPSAGRQP